MKASISFRRIKICRSDGARMPISDHGATNIPLLWSFMKSFVKLECDANLMKLPYRAHPIAIGSARNKNERSELRRHSLADTAIRVRLRNMPADKTRTGIRIHQFDIDITWNTEVFINVTIRESDFQY